MKIKFSTGVDGYLYPYEPLDARSSDGVYEVDDELGEKWIIAADTWDAVQMEMREVVKE